MPLPLPQLNADQSSKVQEVALKEGQRLAKSLAQSTGREGPDAHHLARHFSSFLTEGMAQGDMDRHVESLKRSVDHGIALVQGQTQDTPTAETLVSQARANMRETRSYAHMKPDPVVPLTPPRSAEELEQRRHGAGAAAREPAMRYAQSLADNLQVGGSGMPHYLAGHFSSFLEEGLNRGQMDSYLTALNWAVDSGISSLESHYPERKIPGELIAEARTNLSAMGAIVQPMSARDWQQARSKATPVSVPEQAPVRGMKA